MDNLNLDKAVLLRSLVVITGLALILIGCLVVLGPFIPAILLAIIFCLSTWPAYAWLEEKLNHRRTLASLLMTFGLAVCFIAPLFFLGSSLGENFGKAYPALITAFENKPETLPAAVTDIPWIGPELGELWSTYASDSTQVADTLKQYAGGISQKMIAAGAAIGRGLIDLALGVLIAFFFFRHGVGAAQRLSNLIEQFVGPRGQHLLDVSKKTMIGVVYGVLGTALVQGTLAGVGFWIAGVPGATLLGFATFLLSFVPMGPPLIWIPAAVWLYSNGDVGMAVFIALWGLLLISAVDNVIRPYFISLGSNLPLLLVLLGVFGGILAFGFLGLFIGPTLLALAYTLVVEWSQASSASSRKIIEI